MEGSFLGMVLKVFHGKTMIMVSGGIAKDALSKNIVDPCGVCVSESKG